MLQKKNTNTLSPDDPTAGSETETEDKAPKIDKGKGKAVDDRPPSPMIISPAPMSPTLPPKADISSAAGQAPVMLAGLPFPPSAVSQLLLRAQAELPLRPVRFPLLGEYQDSFTGDEFVGWLNENVLSFGGNLDRAEEAAKQLTERDNLLRRLGEFGNQFEHSDEAFYQFRPKVSYDYSDLKSPYSLAFTGVRARKRTRPQSTITNKEHEDFTTRESEETDGHLHQLRNQGSQCWSN